MKRRRSWSDLVDVVAKLIFIIGLVVFPFVYSEFTFSAAGDVELTGSAFVDPDAEDTHQASQWVITDASGGGNTVFDSGADASNLTTITVPAATFTNGVTYYWKVRYQDQHDVWSDYSAEASFLYGSGATPTPTPTNTATTTTTTTATATATTTTTTTTTVTASQTITITVTITPTVTATDDAPIPLWVNLENPNCNNSYSLGQTMNISYYQDGEIISFARLGSTNSLSELRQDVYLSLDDGVTYNRVKKDVPYTGATWENHLKYSYKVLKVNTTFDIPNDSSYVTDDAKLAVVVYWGASNDQGQTFTPSSTWENTAGPWVGSDRSDCSFPITGEIAPPTVTPTFTPVPGVSLNVLIPKKGDSWKVGEQQEIRWTETYTENSEKIDKVSIYLSRDSGITYDSPLILKADDTGSTSVEVKSSYTTNKAVVKIDAFSSANEKIAEGVSEIFTIGSSQSPIGNTANNLLVLGTVLSALIPFIISLGLASPELVNRAALAVYAMKSPLSFLFPSKSKSKNYSVAFDSITKKPIAKAIVRLYSEPDGRLKESQLTSELGAFGILAGSGDYSLTITKPGYQFPSVLIKDSFANYSNLYTGQTLQIKTNNMNEREFLKVSVPLDPSKYSNWDLVGLKSMKVIQSFFKIIRIPLTSIGTIYTLYLAFTMHSNLNYVILVVYGLIWALEIKNLTMPKKYGIVLDQNGKPLDLVIIRLFDVLHNLKGTVVSSADGKFVLNINKGSYIVEAQKVGYHNFKSQALKINKAQDFAKIKVVLNKINK